MASKSKDRVLTISINNEFIKICDLTRTGKGVIVHKALTIPVPANSYNDGTIKDREYLAKAIKIELDKNRCYELTNILSNAMVVNADARDVDMLEQEGIKSVDAFIAVTENTETNILTCLQAKAYGVKKTIALVENIDYIDISQNIGIDTIINKKLIAASYMVRYTLGDNVSTLKCLSGINGDIMEFLVPDGCLATMRPINRLLVPEGAVIGGIIRGEISFIATGDFQIQAEDRVVVLALPNAIKDVERLFR